MIRKNTLFHHNNKEINFDFSAESVSSDGGVFLLEKIEKKTGLIKSFSNQITDTRHQSYVQHSIYKMLKQRVFLLAQGYQDCNDAKYLENDPAITTVLASTIASQPTLSRFENDFSLNDVYKLSEEFVDNYVATIDKDRKYIIIDVDATDDPTHGNQQLSLFHAYYHRFIYSELLFHDGETGQVILPVLRPGNSHSNRWFVKILDRIVVKIREKHPNIEIFIRADAGYSGAKFYNYANSENIELKFCVGIAKNDRLKTFTEKLEQQVQTEYVDKKVKHQVFFGPFEYQAKYWNKAENCYAKVESTGLGINLRYFCSNMEYESAESLYKDFYVKRGDRSENRIKELKNMCFSGRLSCHNFLANYFRLFLSTLTYELLRQIKLLIKQTGDSKASIWQIDNIRTYLLKVGTIIKIKKKRITVSFSKYYVCRNLFCRIVALC